MPRNSATDAASIPPCPRVRPMHIRLPAPAPPTASHHGTAAWPRATPLAPPRHSVGASNTPGLTLIACKATGITSGPMHTPPRHQRGQNTRHDKTSTKVTPPATDPSHRGLGANNRARRPQGADNSSAPDRTKTAPGTRPPHQPRPLCPQPTPDTNTRIANVAPPHRDHQRKDPRSAAPSRTRAFLPIRKALKWGVCGCSPSSPLCPSHCV